MRRDEARRGATRRDEARRGATRRNDGRVPGGEGVGIEWGGGSSSAWRSSAWRGAVWRPIRSVAWVGRGGIGNAARQGGMGVGRGGAEWGSY